MSRRKKKKEVSLTEPRISPQEIEDMSKAAGRVLTEEETRTFIRNRLPPAVADMVVQARKEMILEIVNIHKRMKAFERKVRLLENQGKKARKKRKKHKKI